MAREQIVGVVTIAKRELPKGDVLRHTYTVTAERVYRTPRVGLPGQDGRVWRCTCSIGSARPITDVARGPQCIHERLLFMGTFHDGPADKNHPNVEVRLSAFGRRVLPPLWAMWSLGVMLDFWDIWDA